MGIYEELVARGLIAQVTNARYNGRARRALLVFSGTPLRNVFPRFLLTGLHRPSIRPLSVL